MRMCPDLDVGRTRNGATFCPLSHPMVDVLEDTKEKLQHEEFVVDVPVPHANKGG